VPSCHVTVRNVTLRPPSSAGSVQSWTHLRQLKTLDRVRILESVDARPSAGEERARLDHFGRRPTAVACLRAPVEKNLARRAHRHGRARILRPGQPQDEEKQSLQERHCGSINAVRVHATPRICATVGDDRANLLGRRPRQADRPACLGAQRTRAYMVVGLGGASLTFTTKLQIFSPEGSRNLWTWCKDGDGQRWRRAGFVRPRSREVRHGWVIERRTAGNALFDEAASTSVLSLGETSEIGHDRPPAGLAVRFSTLCAVFRRLHDGADSTQRDPALQLWRAPSAKVRRSELRLFAWSTGTGPRAFDPQTALRGDPRAHRRPVAGVGNAELCSRREKPLRRIASCVES